MARSLQGARVNQDPLTKDFLDAVRDGDIDRVQKAMPSARLRQSLKV